MKTMYTKEKQVPIQAMYDQRQSFVIVALTGISGSGCSSFAELMATPNIQWDKKLYRPLDKVQPTESTKRREVFYREYRTIYNYALSENNKVYYVINYRHVLFLYTCHYLVKVSQTFEDFIESFIGVINYKFAHSHQEEVQKREEKYDSNHEIVPEDLKRIGMEVKFFETLKGVEIEDAESLANIYFDDCFQLKSEAFYNLLRERDYYAKTFFVHRLASAIRATGDPRMTLPEYEKSVDTKHLFSLVKLINLLIKGYHKIYPKASRRFVIDSIRNSMELLYLRERYNSFYTIALHNDAQEYDFLLRKVSCWENDTDKAKKIVHNMQRLSSAELSTDDLEKGRLYAPDIAKCVSDSEIHIAYKELQQLDEDLGRCSTEDQKQALELSFYSYAEQWMKFSSLMSRPGLITPSSDERNMSIAYVAKFNSGCISRQVGCAIVDKENAIQSIGWNDPPAEQLPCNLRYVPELLNTSASVTENHPNMYHVFSQFELEDSSEYTFKINHDDARSEITQKGFVGCISKDVPSTCLRQVEQACLPYPYCFRSRYNKFKNNKDQVNTRSLHAEENTMLRISRSGGVGLKGGTMYVTASPCVLCSKKAYQIGITDIVYLDPYPDIAPKLVLSCGYGQPRLRPFRGAVGGAFYKLYQPFMPIKDELSIYELMNRE